MDERFRTHERLRKKEEIRNVLQQRGVRGKLCTLHTLRNTGPYSRMAVVVRRVVGKAVIRNRAKRRLREVFRRIKNHLTETVDIVVRVNPGIREARFSDIQEEFISLLQKKNLLNWNPLTVNSDDIDQVTPENREPRESS